MSFPFPGPVPPETNPPINADYYLPKKFNISALQLGETTLVTTAQQHDYVIGQLIRLLIPPTYGCVQINGKTGYVVAIPQDDQVRVNINSVGSNLFIPSPAFGPTPPQIIAIGDINSGVTNTGRSNNTTFIPGSFINVSPN